jgi:hypothetical protein
LSAAHHLEVLMSRPFADVLRELAGGKVYEDLTTQLGEVVTAVMETGKAGEVSVKLSIKSNGEGSVRVLADVKQKIPTAVVGETLFFATSSGSLVRNDPRQAELPLREVKTEQTPLKDALNG